MPQVVSLLRLLRRIVGVLPWQLLIVIDFPLCKVFTRTSVPRLT